MKPFSELAHRGQIGRIRRAAGQMLQEHGLAQARVRLAAHAYNTTFRVSMDDFDAAVRINVNSKRTPAEVRGEVAFVELVHRSGKVPVPQPLALFSGAPYTQVEVPGFEEPRPVASYRWLSGSAPPQSKPGRAGFALGQALCGLHEATEDVDALPEGADRPVLQDVMDSLPMRLPTGGIFEDVLGRANQALDRLKANAPRLMHFDLHFGNVKMHEGRLAAYDFDDSLWAWRAADVAQSMFYLRSNPDPQAMEASFWAGFGHNLDDLEVSVEDFELLVAGRALLLANDLLGNVTAELQEVAPRYLRATEKRLAHLAASGRFEPRIALVKDEA